MNTALHKAGLINAQPRGCKPLADNKPAHWRLELTTSHRIRNDGWHGELTQVAIKATKWSFSPHYRLTVAEPNTCLVFFCKRDSMLPGPLPPTLLHPLPSQWLWTLWSYLNFLKVLFDSCLCLLSFTKLLWYKTVLSTLNFFPISGY